MGRNTASLAPDRHPTEVVALTRRGLTKKHLKT